MSTPRTFTFPAFALVALGSCRSPGPLPDLGGIYNQNARHHDAARNPVIVIPGILGSKLIEPETGTIVWGAFGGDYASPATPEGARLVALPMGKGTPLRDLRDEVEPAGVLDRLEVKLLGLPLELHAYLQILKTLGAGGYRDETLARARTVDYGDAHFTCFQFDYDWRRDNVENARRLHQFILAKRAYVREEIRRRFGVDNPEVKFDIIAHSMGGLITRYYLRYGAADLPADGSPPAVTWEGAKLIDRAVLIGTPSAGSAEAIIQLVEGISFSRVFPRYQAALLGTFPAIYQLFPRARHGPLRDAADPERRLDPFRPERWGELRWGLAAPDQEPVLEAILPEVRDPAERRAIALDHLRKCLERAERLAEALDRPEAPPPGLKLYLIAGDAIPTKEVLSVRKETGRLSVLRSAPGDRTVLRSSALLDERVGSSWQPALRSPIRWERVQFLFSDHLGMTRDPAFTDNVLYILLEDPR